MNPKTASAQSHHHTDRPTPSSNKNELVTTIGGVVPIASFVIKLWVKILKLSFKAAVWMVRKLPSPIKRVDNSSAGKSLPQRNTGRPSGTTI